MKTLIPAQKQTVWGWPAVVNFSLGGAGTGLYLLGALLLHPLPWFVALGAPALAGLGLLTLTTEAGRPMRGLNLFRHLRRSWMSREALAAAIFIPMAAADWLLPHPALRAVAVLAAAALMVSQGFILYGARGVTAWNIRLMPLLFVTCGFSAGAGLLYPFAPGLSLAAAGALACAANLAVWLTYLRLPGEDFAHATQLLRSPKALGVVVGIGHMLPLVLLGLGLTLGWSGPAALMLVLAGVAQIAGATIPKVGIVLKAGYLRPIRLSTPVHRVGVPRYKSQGGIDLAELQVGMKGQATLVVDESNTADQGGKGAAGVHVLGTPSLVGLLEMAAWNTVQEHLAPGMASVGTVVNVQHLAATPLGMKVTAHAEITKIEGRRLIFRVWAEDEVEKVAEAEHERFIVNLEKALEKAKAKSANRAG